MMPAAEVVLVGNGHCHLEVIREYKKLSPKPYRLTLVSEFSDGIYKGMLPRLISGDISPQMAFLDIGHLCCEAGVRYIKQKVTKISLDEKRIYTTQPHQQINYDVLSLDVGAVPKSYHGRISSLAHKTISIKPLRLFLDKLIHLEMVIKTRFQGETFHLVVEGGDYRSFEIVNALGERVKRSRRLSERVALHFIDSKNLAPPLSPKEWRKVSANFKRLNISTHGSSHIVDHQDNFLILADDTKVPCNCLIQASNQQGNELLETSGLDLDQRGLVRINPNLESSSHLGVYAVASTAAWSHPYILSQSTTYSLPMSRILAKNLGRRFSGLQQIQCNKSHKIGQYMYLGRDQALYHKGKAFMANRFMRDRKLRLDMKWYDRYFARAATLRTSTYMESGNLSIQPCRGSADSLPYDVQHPLAQALYGLSGTGSKKKFLSQTSVRTISLEGGTKLMQSMGALSAFTKDLFGFAKVAVADRANYLYALGQAPQSARVIVTVPYGPKRAMNRDANDLLAGMAEGFGFYKIQLDSFYCHAGPLANIGIELEAVFSDGVASLQDQFLEEGDALILTKPLGTGVMFSGYERFKVSSRHLWQALSHMTLSHESLLSLSRKYPMRTMCAVSSYGLAGAIASCVPNDNFIATINLKKLPLYGGMLSALSEGIRSSIHSQNRIPYTKTLQLLSNHDRAIAEFLFDPQTAGPILIGIPAEHAEALCKDLRYHRLRQASIIGQIKNKEHKSQPLIICQG